MAKATTRIDKEAAAQEELTAKAFNQIIQSVAERSEALLKFLDVLGELHQLGVLDAAEALLKNKQDIALIGIQQMNKPGAHRIIKNGMGAVQLLSSIDPSKLQTLLNGVAEGVAQSSGQHVDRKQMGLWGIAKTMRKPETMASLNMMMQFLQGMGKSLKEDPQAVH